MKTNAIVRIIIYSILLVFLSGVLLSFVAEELYLNEYASTALGPVSADTEIPVSVLPSEETLTLDPASVQEIEIEWVSGDIIIQPMDTNVITISESDIHDPRYAMVWQHRNQKLEIHFCEETIAVGFGINSDKVFSKDLYVYVPQNWNCDSLEIDAASATVEMNQMTIRKLDFDGASGDFTLNDCDIRDLDIDTASGDVRFSGTLDTLDFDAASASFIGNFYNTPSRIDMDGMSGSLDISLPADCSGYTLSMDGMSSRFSSDFQGTTMKQDAHVYGDGRCRIDVDGMSCDVTIRRGEDAPAFCCPEPDCTIPEEHTHTSQEEIHSNEAASNQP